ncbi:MAG TPA: M20/M25/M40 family metallo-hydrolase [Candidatus Limnocylindrales bacterium]|nr:M20/M25/M40 family metallo-hydrolase [Candidatus Limnocylindrales bacterium]
MNRPHLSLLVLLLSLFVVPTAVSAGTTASEKGGSPQSDLSQFVSTPAVSGYESQLGQKIRSKLSNLNPVIDNLGDVIVTIGSGSPSRLLVAPIDEPGLVVSGITDDGYLRVQRLPQNGLPPIYNELYSAQPVKVETNTGKWIDGVVAGLSVHLQPGRMNPPRLTDLENIYIDIGATSAAEVRRAGIDNLSPVVISRRLFDLAGSELAGTSMGDRFGAAILVDVLRNLDSAKVKGTLTVAFVVQQRTGARGLERLLETRQFDEMVYVGRLLPGGPIPGAEGMHRAPRREPGSGVLVGMSQTDGSLEGLAAELKQLADSNQIPFASDYSSGIAPPSYLAAPSFPPKWAHLGVATAWPDTPAETLSAKDLGALGRLVGLYVGASTPSGSGGGMASGEEHAAMGAPGAHMSNVAILSALVPSYGVSNHEGPVRDEVKKLLPPWAKPETDDAGNLVLRVGTAPAGAKTPSILVVAHMDEIGYEVKSISSDGRLEVTSQGGGEPSFFLGHPALVHAANGDHDAIMELPNGWDDPKFEWPRGRNSGTAIRVDVGARTPDEVEKLGIKVGDTVTIPKAYRPLLGTRANGRSFDDRVGDTALISAAWALGGPLKDRNVTFVFSTAEEIGLNGAAATAKRLGVGNHPDYVFAVDTFVSSDSPIESKRFADAPIGKGFVIRAVDNSNIVRPDLVERVIKLARANQIPVQYGVTGGGNDGSAFLRYGSVDVALGWPLRYSHSPGEVIDTRDVDALAHIITAISKSW